MLKCISSTLTKTFQSQQCSLSTFRDSRIEYIDSRDGYNITYVGIRFNMCLKLRHVMFVEFNTMLFKHGYVSREPSSSSQASIVLFMSELRLLKLRLANFSLGIICNILNIWNQQIICFNLHKRKIIIQTSIL